MPNTGQATVTLKHLAAALAEEHELAKKQSQELLNDAVGLVTKHLKKGDRIRLAGLSILQVRKRSARMGRNPATGEPIKIKASKKVAFRAAKDLRAAVSYGCELVGGRVLLQDFSYLPRNYILIVRRDLPKLVYDVLKWIGHTAKYTIGSEICMIPR